MERCKTDCSARGYFIDCRCCSYGGLTALFCYYALHVGLLESLLIGSLISSTDVALVFRFAF